MTTEEKAKAYDHALKVIEKYKDAHIMLTQDLKEEMFPELAESKDEKIINVMLAVFGDGRSGKWCGLEIKDIVDWLKKQKDPTDKGEISDGYHTFNELYYYRMLYNAAFFNLLPKEWVHKSKKHHDGEECFGGGWFIVMAQLPTGQISNHYELKDWDLFHVPEKEVADEWDGHSPQEAAERLHKYLLEEQDECPEYCVRSHCIGCSIYEKQKEQKPAEWSDSFEENIRNLLHDKLTWHSEDGSMSSTVFIDDKTLKDIVSGIWFYVGKEVNKYPNRTIL